MQSSWFVPTVVSFISSLLIIFLNIMILDTAKAMWKGWTQAIKSWAERNGWFRWKVPVSDGSVAWSPVNQGAALVPQPAQILSRWSGVRTEAKKNGDRSKTASSKKCWPLWTERKRNRFILQRETWFRPAHGCSWELAWFSFPAHLWRNSALEEWKWKWSHSVRLFVTPWTVAYQAPLSMGFSRQ